MFALFTQLTARFTGLVRGLTIGRKLSLIAIALGIPIAVLLYLLLSEQSVAIEFARNERDGVQVLKPIRALVADLQEHRALAAASLGGDTASRSRLIELGMKLDVDLLAIEAAEQQVGREYGMKARVGKVRDGVQELKAWSTTGMPQESFDRHTELIRQQAMGLLLEVGNASQLTLDPDLDTYWLMDTVIVKAADLAEVLSKIRAVATIDSTKRGSGGERLLLQTFATQARELVEAINRGLEFAIQETPSLGAPLQPLRTSVETAIRGLVGILQRPTSETEGDENLQRHAEINAATGRSVQSVVALTDGVETSLDARLQDRIGRLGRARGLSLGFVLSAVLVSLAFLFWVAREITTAVQQLAAASVRISEGDLSVQVPVRSSDEIGRLAGTFNATVQRLRGQVQTEAERDDERRQREELQHNISRFLDTVMDIAKGDLTRRGDVTADVLGNVVDAINVMVDELATVLVGAQSTAGRVSAGTRELIVAADQLGRGAQSQSREAVGVSSAMEEVSLSVRQVAEIADASSRAARQVEAAAGKGDQSVADSLESMQRIRAQVQTISKRIKGLGERSLEISEIVDTIEDIAGQTNLLALNAAIEAAGAGEAGLRFAVVADEVRKLAERAAGAAKQIATLIKNVQAETQEAVVAMEDGTNDVEAGYKITLRAGESLKEIGDIAKKSAELAQDISLATQQQVRGADSVSTAVQSIARVARDTELSVTETRKTMDDLAALAGELGGTLARFKLPAA